MPPDSHLSEIGGNYCVLVERSVLNPYNEIKSEEFSDYDILVYIKTETAMI